MKETISKYHNSSILSLSMLFAIIDIFYNTVNLLFLPLVWLGRKICEKKNK